jgi:hypothetical protein
MLWPSINGYFWGYIFFGGISPSKIGHIAPFLATIQALSKTCVFLHTQKKSRMLCMGHTYTANRGNNLKNEKNSLKICGYREKWCKVLPARVLFVVQILTIFSSGMIECNFTHWASGDIGLLWCNTRVRY